VVHSVRLGEKKFRNEEKTQKKVSVKGRSTQTYEKESNDGEDLKNFQKKEKVSS